MAERDLLIRGGTVVDATGARRADVRVHDGVVVEVGERLDADAATDAGSILDAGGCLVAPGLVDLHTHLREPGMEDAETVVTGARAAALGGYTAVVAMPNTDPAIDDASMVRHVLELGRDAACRVAVAGAVSIGREGARLAPLAEMHAQGVRLFTDDGACVDDPRLMRYALEYARSLPGAVIAQHAEDARLVADGHMHEGAWSSRLGIPGRPAAAESMVVARDLALARLTGGRIHFLHLSTAESVELVRQARAAGLRVTAEVTPHHLTLTDAACAGFDPRFKVNPPLREAADVEALRSALVDGTVDAVATDHAPHPPQAKDQPFAAAPPGMLGLETAFAVLHTELVLPGLVDAATLLARMSWGPAAVAGLADQGRPVAPGEPANLCVLDAEAVWEVDAARLASRARNTPYTGRKLTGRVRHTILGGAPVVVDGEARR